MASEIARQTIEKKLKEGNSTWKELWNVCQEIHISRTTFSSTLVKMRDREHVVTPQMRLWSHGQEPQIEYAWTPEGSTPEDRAVAAIAKFFDIARRYPTGDELALEMETKPKDAENTAYRSSGRTGWRPPTPEEILHADDELGMALYVAVLTSCQAPLPRLATEADKIRANELSEKYPDLIPTWVTGRLKWPSMTMRYMHKEYDANSRAVAF